MVNVLIPATMFCWIANKTFDDPFCLMPGHMYCVAYLRRGLESQNGQCLQIWFFVCSFVCFIFPEMAESLTVQMTTFYGNWDWRCAINFSSVKTFLWNSSSNAFRWSLPIKNNFLSTFCIPWMDLSAHIPATAPLSSFCSVCFKRWGSSSSERGSNLLQITYLEDTWVCPNQNSDLCAFLQSSANVTFSITLFFIKHWNKSFPEDYLAFFWSPPVLLDLYPHLPFWARSSSSRRWYLSLLPFEVPPWDYCSMVYAN